MIRSPTNVDGERAIVSPVGPLVLIVPVTLFMLATRNECRDLEGLPSDQRAVMPIMYRIFQVAVAVNLIWLAVTIGLWFS